MDTNQFQDNVIENTWLWLVKIIAGLGIFIFLTIHLIANHLIVPEGLLSYADILRYYSNPIVPIMEAGFLFFAIVHSLLGLRSIILDLNPSPKTMRFINPLIIVVGSVAIIYGLWILLLLIKRVNT